MIVGIDIDRENDLLKFFTKDLLDSKNEFKVKLSEVRLNKDWRWDLITYKDCECALLVHRNKIIGRVFLNHFTWSGQNIMEELRGHITEK